MQIRLDDATPCCGLQPYLDTWDENEMRSIHCSKCERKTGSYFMRSMAYEEWENMMKTFVQNPNEDKGKEI